MNKILRLNIEPHTVKSGGGAADYAAPLNLSGHINLLHSLKKINAYSFISAYTLLNKKTKPIQKDDIALIPAPRKRFVEDMKFVFGLNKLTYETTFFSNEEKNLHFIYNLGYDQIEDAITRLETLNELFSYYNADDNISEFFQNIKGEKKKQIGEKINQIAKENNLRNFTLTKIHRYLSSQYHQFLSFELLSKQITLNKETIELTFSSSSIANIESKKLEKLRLNINSINKEKIVINGTISKDSKLFLNGVVSINKDANLLFNKNEKTKSTNKFELNKEKTLNTVIGVIDGGISDGIIKDNLYKYEDNITLEIGGNIPKGNHAEEVVSLIMFANKLSKKTDDKLESPKIALFNIITEDMKYLEFKKYLRYIIKKNHKQIKIWNMSINFDVKGTEFEVSDYAVFLDDIQKEFDVIFIVSTGNISTGEGKMLPPSDSFRAISVSSVKTDFTKTSYTRKGRVGFYSSKPDVSIFGGDINDRITVISGDIPINTTGGSSYSTPLITRLVSNLFEMNYSLLEIPAIISSYSAWIAKEKKLDNIFYYPSGVLPIDNSELFNMIKNKLMWVSTVELSGKYKQGFYQLKFPMFESSYDFKFIISYNVDATLAKNSTFEYVLDSTKVILGRENPFKLETITTTDSLWLHSEYLKREGLSKFNALTESSQRIFKGKYKNRNTIISWPKRTRSSFKTQRSQSGENKSREIKNWGLAFTRDIIDNTIARENKENQKISIAFIGESHNSNFYNNFIDLNQNIIQNLNLDDNIKNTISDDFIFE